MKTLWTILAIAAVVYVFWFAWNKNQKPLAPTEPSYTIEKPRTEAVLPPVTDWGCDPKSGKCA